MISFQRFDQNSFSFTIDPSIFSEKVITKSLYNYANDYMITWEKVGEIFSIVLRKKDGVINQDLLKYLSEKINRDLIDYKTREIIFSETKDIRNIILIKAFSNNDDFEDINLLRDEA